MKLVKQSPDTGRGGKELGARVSGREHSSTCRPFYPGNKCLMWVNPIPVLQSQVGEGKTRGRCMLRAEMLEMGEDPVSDGKKTGVPLPQYPSLQRDQ